MWVVTVSSVKRKGDDAIEAFACKIIAREGSDEDIVPTRLPSCAVESCAGAWVVSSKLEYGVTVGIFSIMELEG